MMFGWSRGGGGIPAYLRQYTYDLYIDFNAPDGGDGSVFRPFNALSDLETAALSHGDGVEIGVVGTSTALLGSMDLSSLSGVQINGIDIGEGLPHITGYTVIDTWTQPDSGTYPSVWAASITHAVGVDISRLILTEDGLPVARTTSIALVNATEARRYCPQDGALPANNPATMNLHATGSGNPNSNGKEYAASTTGGIVLGDGAKVSGLILDMCPSNNGAVQVARSGDISRIVIGVSGKHHLFASGNSRVRDVVALLPDLPISGDGGQSLFIGYDEDASDKDILFERCFGIAGVAVSQPQNPMSSSAIYSHSNGGNLWRSVTYKQSANLDGISSPGFAVGDALQASMIGLFSRGADKAISVGSSAYARAAEILYSQVYNCQTGIFDLQPAGASVVNARHNVCRPWNWGLTRKMLYSNANVSGAFEYNALVAPAKYIFAEFLAAVTHRYNIYVTSESGAPYTVLTLPSGSTSDCNVYINLGTADLVFSYGGVTYTGLANYQAGTGQEANSLYFTSASLGDIFSGTVANGDFRLNAGGGVGAQVLSLGAGPQYHWDWNAKAVAAGPPVAWPDIPADYAEALEYVGAPGEWVF